MEALLRIHDLSVRYRTDNGAIHCAVSGVTFEIGDGEAVGLVGESGCGKTSLGLALLGLHGDTAEVTGSVFLAGRDLLTLDERSFQQIRGAKIALISQDLGLALSPVLRVGDQIAEVLHAHSGLRLVEKWTGSTVRLQTRNSLLRETFWNYYHKKV